MNWSTVFAELVYAWRSLWRTPALTLGIAVTAAIAVAGNVASLSVLDRLLFRQPAGIRQPKEIHRLYARKQVWNRAAYTTESFSYPDYTDLAAVAGSERVAAYATGPERLVRESGRRASVSFVSAGLFDLLGVKVHRGRLFGAADVPSLGPTEALISYAFWKSTLGADSAVLGRVLTLDELSISIVGVASKEFVGIDLEPVDVWLPLGARRNGREAPWWSNRDAQFLSIVARLKRKSPPAEMMSQFTTAYRRAHEHDESPDPRATVLVAPLASARGPGELPPLAARNFSLAQRLSAISVAVLLVSGVNCASMLLLWAFRRRREIGVRLALGLSRGRLFLRSLSELLVLAGVTAVGGAILAVWGSAILQTTVLSTIRGDPQALDHRGVLAAIVLATATVFGAGIGPLIFLLRTSATDAVRYAGSSGGADDSRLRALAIIGQTALSLALISLAAVFLFTIRADLKTSLKYDPERLATVVTTGQQAVRSAEALTRIRVLPFVESAATSIAELPPGRAMTRFAPVAASTNEGVLISFNAVDTGYFRTVGLTPIAGRSFTSNDRAASEPVVIVTDATARSFWPSADPIGQCALLFGGQECARVVGVVPDVRWDIATPAMRHFYVPLEQAAGRVGQIITVRTRGAATPAHALALERALMASDSAGFTPNVYLVAPRLDRQLGPLRAASVLLVVYAVLVFISALVGMYGRVCYEIAQRTRELGVRAALGASPVDLVTLVMTSSTWVLALGLALGIVVLAVGGGFMTRFVYGASADDPRILAVVVIGLLGSGMIAMLVAARRVARLSPAVALRVD